MPEPQREEATAHVARRREAALRRRRNRRRRLAALAGVAVAGAGIVAVLAGGGGGAHSGRGGKHSGGEGGLVWTGYGSGRPPSIAAENKQEGNASWRLPAHFRSGGHLEGYVSGQDVRPGDAERLYINAPKSRWVRVRIFRIGWYGGRGGRLVASSRRLPALHQPRCNHAQSTGLTECDWRRPLSFRIPDSAPSGVYIARMDSSSGGARECLFVVEAREPGRIVAQIPTATYEAYNAFGGDSLYPGGDPVAATGTGQGVEVSYDRPYDSGSGAGQFLQGDVAMVQFLERGGYPVSYTTSTGLDSRPGQLGRSRVALDIGHSEYWSARAESAFAQALRAGTNLAFFSSDTLAWRIRLRPATKASSEVGRGGHRIVAYKEYAGRDPSGADATFPGDGAPLTGSAYTGCITMRTQPSGPRIYHYYSWHPDAGLSPAWLYRGTGLQSGDRIDGILGYELDRVTSRSPRGVQVVGSGSAPCQEPGIPTDSETTLYRSASGALVFASGTLGWQLGLRPVPDVSPDTPSKPDPRLVKLTENLLARLGVSRVSP